MSSDALSADLCTDVKSKLTMVTADSAARDEADSQEAGSVLGEVGNQLETEPRCAFCQKTKPSKRCSKRHPKCLKKMFCNESCESMAHKKKEDPQTASKVPVKKADSKKKSKKDKHKNSGGEFWWNNSVYASW